MLLDAELDALVRVLVEDHGRLLEQLLGVALGVASDELGDQVFVALFALVPGIAKDGQLGQAGHHLGVVGLGLAHGRELVEARFRVSRSFALFPQVSQSHLVVIDAAALLAENGLWPDHHVVLVVAQVRRRAA